MKILLANKFYYPRGGPETVMLQQEKHLKKMGHEVIPFAMQDERNLGSEYSHYFVSKVDYQQMNGSPLGNARIAMNMIYSSEAKHKLEQLLELTRPEIAHLHNIYHQISPSILKALKKRKIPIVMTLHDFKLVCPNYSFYRDGQNCEECQGRKFYKAVQHRCIQNSRLKSLVCAVEGYWHNWTGTYSNDVDRFIVLSRFSLNKFIQYGLPEDKLALLPNGLELKEYKPSFQPGDYVLFAGRLNQKYGVFTLLEAARSLPEISFRLAGNGEDEEKVKKFVEERKLGNVKLLGFLSPEKLKQEISKCRFVVFPATIYHNCPMVILEAFALGKPVVASDIGSIPELVEKNVSGLLFETGSVSGLADQIVILYNQPKLVRELGQNAREKVERDYSAINYYPRLLQLYQELLPRRINDN
jgi:glycosyltransferase involved in cell wall biosynthesis